MMQYDDKIAISIANLVETTQLTRYSRPIELKYDRGSEFIGHEFRKTLIEDENGITDEPITLGNNTYNAMLERIQQVLGNLVRNFNIIETYVDKDNPWLGILDATAFTIISTTTTWSPI